MFLREAIIAVKIFLIINTLVFLAWNIVSRAGPSEIMIDHFLVSWDGLMQGRFWTLITSVFSHNMFLHFFMNMFVLNSFGPVLERILGTRRFVIIYFLAGIFSSFCHAFVSAWLLGQPDLPALGASGAISAVILIFSFMFPKQTILLFGLIPLPALWGAILFIGLDVWGLIEQAEGGGLPIGHGAHLGGAFTGIVYYYLFIRSKIKKSYLA